MKLLKWIFDGILNVSYWTLAIPFPATANLLFNRNDADNDYGDEYL